MSADLVWQLTRNRSAYLIKRDGVEFSTEPNNLTNRNLFKFSGLANRKAVGVVANKAGRIHLNIKRSRTSGKRSATRNPRRQFARVPLNKHVVNHSCRSAEVVQALTKKSFYRPDLARFAIARYHALHKAISIARGGVTKKTKKTDKNAKPAKKSK